MPELKPIRGGGTHAIHPEDPSVSGNTTDLRARIDAYRLELQKLQDELEERQSVFRLTKTLARRLLKEPLLKLTGHYRRATHRDDRLLKTASFKPYVLRYKNAPGTATRPVVLHIIGTFGVGGLPRLVVDIIEGTSDTYDHVVLTLRNPVPPAFRGVEVLEIAEKTSVCQMSRQMAAFRPSIIHVHHCAPHSLHHAWLWYRTSLLAAASLGVPLIEGVNVPMTPYYHPSVSAYVFVSHYVKESFGFTDCPNHVIYPGSDFSLFSPRARRFSDAIGMVYRLDESKLRKESIDVFIRVLQLRPSAKAVIVGDGYLLPYFKEQVDRAGLTNRFTFTGFVSYADLPDLYNQMDVFVAPVFCESFGQVTPFAMNMGIPVAAYATGALPEILNDPFVIAPPGDITALARIIIELLQNPSRCTVIAGINRERAATLFPVEVMTNHYRNLYAMINEADYDAYRIVP